MKNTGSYGNYQPDIHNAAYLADYAGRVCNAETLINIEGRERESLNGLWNYAVDQYDTCRRAKWWKAPGRDAAGNPMPVDWDWEAWDRIKVPASWNTEYPELFYYERTLIYTRTFRYVPKAKDERLILRFEGVSYNACVFINGAFAGSHDGASTPFNIDITDLVKADNRIIVTVDANRSPLRIPMDNTDWFNYGGIYRDIYLIRLPKAHITDWFARLAPGNGFNEILADVYTSGDGKASVEIPELGIKADGAIQNGKASFSLAARPELWSPENPKLYEVKVSFEGGGNSDSVTDKIGFR